MESGRLGELRGFLRSFVAALKEALWVKAYGLPSFPSTTPLGSCFGVVSSLSTPEEAPALSEALGVTVGLSFFASCLFWNWEKNLSMAPDSF